MVPLNVTHTVSLKRVNKNTKTKSFLCNILKGWKFFNSKKKPSKLQPRGRRDQEYPWTPLRKVFVTLTVYYCRILFTYPLFSDVVSSSGIIVLSGRVIGEY
jgi:hypothetical protein